MLLRTTHSSNTPPMSDDELTSYVLSHPHFRKNRLPSLFSDFSPLASTNPSGFTANVTAWHALLSDASSRGLLGPDKLVLTTDAHLVTALAQPQWGRPLALGAAVAAVINKRDFWPLDAFLTQRESIYYWSYAGAALKWGLGMMGFGGGMTVQRGKMLEGKWVVVRNIENVAKEVIAKVKRKTSRVERIYTTDLFIEELQPGISQVDLKVLFRYLARDMCEAAYNGKVIKFKSEDERLTPVNEQDVSIAQLRSLVHTLNQRVETLNTNVETCTEKARVSVASKNRMMALAALKSRKVAESALDTSIKSLDQVQTVLAKIEEAANNVELITQLERSSRVLTQLNAQAGGIERIERVMDELREGVEHVDEVNALLGESGGHVVDEGEVDDELNAMFTEESRKETERVHEKKVHAERLADEEALARTLESLQIVGDCSKTDAKKENATETPAKEPAERQIPLPAK